MRDYNSSFLKKHVQQGSIPRIRQSGVLNNLWWLAPIFAATIAYSVGFKPPRNFEVTYQEKKIDLPIQKILGYELSNFSRLELSEKKDAQKEARKAVFYPNSAVKNFEGEKFVERSRQLEQMYFYNCELEDILLTLHMPKKPSGIYLGNDDMSMFAKEVGTQYEINIPLAENLFDKVAKDNISSSSKSSSNTSSNKEIGLETKFLELFIYYKNDNSSMADSIRSRHLEDAERYLIRFVK